MVDIRPSDDPALADRLLTLLFDHAEAQGFPFGPGGRIALEAWEDGVFLGGLTARHTLDWVYLERLALAPEGRGRGAGAQLLAECEGLAHAAGKAGVMLDTFEFQAPGFYEKAGYRRVGQVDDHPKGSTRYFYAKRF